MRKMSEMVNSGNLQIRPLCAKSNETYLDFSFREQFSPEEHTKILQTINESSPEDLSR